MTGVTTAATAMSVSASRLRKDKAVDLRSNYSGTVLRSDFFSLCTPDFLAIGGNPVTTEVAFRMHADMDTCEMSADMLRDLGVFSLLNGPTDETAAAAAGSDGKAADAAAAVPGAEGAPATTAASSDVDTDPAAPKMGKIPAAEKHVILDLLEVELFGFADRAGNFLSDAGPTSAPAARASSTPGKDKDGWF